MPEIAEILKTAQTIAVVGLSSNPYRASHGVASYLKSQGYRIIPVNPNEQEVLGEKAYATLGEVSEPVDIVDIFRRSEYVGPIMDAAIQKGVKAVWMQEGVSDEESAKRGRDAGIAVVMDRCILKEHRRLR